MSDSRKAGAATLSGDNLVDAAAVVGTSLARVGTLMVSWPFYLLPEQERDDAIAATNHFFTAVGELHLSVVRAAVRGLSAATREITKGASEQAPSAAKTTTRVPIETAPSTTR